MAKKWLTALDLSQNELRNAVVQNLGSAPGTPINGQVYYSTAGSHDLQLRLNGSWVSLVPTSLLGATNTWTAANTFNGAITGNNTINLTGVGASSVGGTLSATAHISTGLTGATAVSRYVGATASGAPGSGTFAVGDYVVDQTGTAWVCTAAGSPGTWKRVGDYLLGVANSWTASQTFTAGLIANSAITGNNTINLTGVGASSVAGTFTGTALVASGLTGAAAASRYVGATASGSPSSGTFAVGDFIVAQNGHIWVCTGAGTPGTWTDVSTASFPGYGTVVTETSYAQASNNGANTTVSRSDHTHGTPTHIASDHSAIKISDLAAPTADVSFNSHKITNLLDPTNPQDAATKNYVDSSATGLDIKVSVRAATTGALAANTYANGTAGVGATLTGNANGALAAVDGVNVGAATNQTITAMTNVGTTVTATVATTAQMAVGQRVTIAGAAGLTNVNGDWTVASLPSGTTFTFVVATAPTGSYTASSATEATSADRLLVKNEATAANNGIYTVTQVGTAGTPYILTRATDADQAAEINAGAYTYVESGTTYTGTGWVMTTTGGIIIGTTSLNWTVFSGGTTYTAGAGLTSTSGVFSIGAGTGISVLADGVAVDTTVVARKFSQQIGTGAATSIAVTHSLGNQWVNVQVFSTSAPFDEQECDIQLTDANTVTLLFTTAPASNALRVVVTG